MASSQRCPCRAAVASLTTRSNSPERAAPLCFCGDVAPAFGCCDGGGVCELTAPAASSRSAEAKTDARTAIAIVVPELTVVDRILFGSRLLRLGFLVQSVDDPTLSLRMVGALEAVVAGRQLDVCVDEIGRLFNDRLEHLHGFFGSAGLQPESGEQLARREVVGTNRGRAFEISRGVRELLLAFPDGPELKFGFEVVHVQLELPAQRAFAVRLLTERQQRTAIKRMGCRNPRVDLERPFELHPSRRIVALGEKGDTREQVALCRVARAKNPIDVLLTVVDLVGVQQRGAEQVRVREIVSEQRLARSQQRDDFFVLSGLKITIGQYEI